MTDIWTVIDANIKEIEYHDFDNSISEDGFIFVDVDSVPGKVITSLQKVKFNYCGILLSTYGKNTIYGINFSISEKQLHETATTIHNIALTGRVNKIYYKKLSDMFTLPSHTFRSIIAENMLTAIQSCIVYADNVSLTALGISTKDNFIVRLINTLYNDSLSIPKACIDSKRFLSLNVCSDHSIPWYISPLLKYKALNEKESFFRVAIGIFAFNVMTDTTILLTTLKAYHIKGEDFASSNIVNVYESLLKHINSDDKRKEKITKGINDIVIESYFGKDDQ